MLSLGTRGSDVIHCGTPAGHPQRFIRRVRLRHGLTHCATISRERSQLVKASTPTKHRQINKSAGSLYSADREQMRKALARH